MRMNFMDGWIYGLQGQEKTAVILPHDAMIEGPRSKNSKGGGANAYFEGGIYEYEKKFYAPEEWKEKCVWLEFEGIYRNAKVYVNENLAGEWAYGYTGFTVYLDGFLQYGAENVVRVVADNSQLPNSRWYTGGGIYRPVNLIVKNKTHFEFSGIEITTLEIEPAKLAIASQRNGGNVFYRIMDGDTCVGELDGDGEIYIKNAKLWSDETPHLYCLQATLTENGEIVDEEELLFGIRLLTWSNQGFFVNGKNTLLRGGCVHHDNGILGARCFAEAEERKVRLIKEAGFNAIRFSHNPCSKAFAAACDKYGVYLIDEFSDMWYSRKKKFDYALDFEKWHKQDLAAMVHKDKNHPSVIMYSIGNEVSEPCGQKGIDATKDMVEYLHSLDATRPVTAGINFYIIVNAAKGKGVYSESKVDAEDTNKPQSEKPTSSTLFNMIATKVGPSMNKMGNSNEADKLVSPCLDLLDICGYNYASGRYALEGKKHPKRILFGSETYPQDIYKNWQDVQKYPYLIGDFMWTAIDYLGEVGIGGWTDEPIYGFTFEKPYPWLIADTGAIDLIGTIGAEAKYASTVWGLEKSPYIGVRPLNYRGAVIKSVWRGTDAVNSWAWRGCEGKSAEIEVYSSAPYVELYQNGKLLKRKTTKACKASFKAKYQKGTITAVALDEQKRIIAKSELTSATEELSIRIIPEKQTVKVGEIVYIKVQIVDSCGTVESNADELLTATVKNGTLLAFGSAAQKSEYKYSGGTFTSYRGEALAAVRATQPGKLLLTVRGASYREKAVEITVAED